jgi:hypothetical protein
VAESSIKGAKAGQSELEKAWASATFLLSAISTRLDRTIWRTKTPSATAIMTNAIKLEKKKVRRIFIICVPCQVVGHYFSRRNSFFNANCVNSCADRPIQSPK